MKQILLLVILLCGYTLLAQDVKIIKLKQTAVSYRPRNFKIAKVIDDRPDTTNIGVTRVGFGKKRVPLNLYNGASAAVNNFLQTNVIWNENATSVDLYITNLNVTEKAEGLSEQATLDIAVAFYEDGNKIIEYNGSSYAKAGIDATAYIEALIRQRLEELLKQFDNWQGENAGADNVQVAVEIPTKSDNEDQIYYNRSVPLSLDDFKGEPDDLSLGAAATSSGLGMKYTHQRVGRAIILKVYLFAYFDRSRSWCKTTGRNAAVLAHEQRHFDITAIKCNELAEAIQKYSFSKDNYAKELDQLLRDYDKQLGKQQQLYDHETDHGVNRAKQKAWDQDILHRLPLLKH